jgi:hypothetical protein
MQVRILGFKQSSYFCIIEEYVQLSHSFCMVQDVAALRKACMRQRISAVAKDHMMS